MRTIQRKVLLTIALIVSISTILVGGVAAYLNYQTTADVLQQSMEASVQLAAERVSYELKGYENIAVEVGCMPSLSSSMVSTEEKQRIIEERVRRYGFRQGNLMDVNGLSLVDGIDYGDRAYVQLALAGETSVSNPMTNRRDGETAIFIAAPLWQDGLEGTEIVGVVCFTPQMTFLDDIISSIQISEHSGVMMWDTSQTLIADSTQALVDADRCFTAYAPIDGTDGWSIGLFVQSEDVLQGTMLSIRLTIVLILIIMGLASLLGLVISKRLTKSFGESSKRLEALSEGDINSPVPESYSDGETKILANATKTIVSSLQNISQDLEHVLRAISEGDFTVEEHTDYPGDYKGIHDAIQMILASLNAMMVHVRAASTQVAIGAEQIASGAQILSQGSIEQAASVEELSVTMSEILTQTQQTAEHANIARETAVVTGEEIYDGTAHIKRMHVAMEQIQYASQQVVQIVSVIEQVASKTKLLAINASIEAANHSQESKGFLVIAEEISALAQQSTQAAKDTARLVEDSLQEIEKGRMVMNATTDVFRHMEAHVESVIRSVEQISEATASQSIAIRTVSQGLDQIAVVTQQTSAASEENASAGEELHGQAQALKHMIDQLKLRDEPGQLPR